MGGFARQKNNIRPNAVFSAILIISITLLIGGCASPLKKLTLRDDTKSLDKSKEALLLLRLKISNQVKPDRQPYIKSITISGGDKENSKFYVFGPYEGGIFVEDSFKDALYKEVKNEFNEYLASFSLPPGTYTLEGVRCISIDKAAAQCRICVFANFEVKANEVFYLGRIEATIRERKNDDELPARSLFIPSPGRLLAAGILAIAASNAGFSTGTFDVKITDNYEEDMAAFKQKYPVLNNYPVKKQVLPPWQKQSYDCLKQ